MGASCLSRVLKEPSGTESEYLPVIRDEGREDSPPGAVFAILRSRADPGRTGVRKHCMSNISLTSLTPGTLF